MKSSEAIRRMVKLWDRLGGVGRTAFLEKVGGYEVGDGYWEVHPNQSSEEAEAPSVVAPEVADFVRRAASGESDGDWK